MAMLVSPSAAPRSGALGALTPFCRQQSLAAGAFWISRTVLEIQNVADTTLPRHPESDAAAAVCVKASD